MSIFQRNRNVIVCGMSRARIVRRRAGCSHPCAIGVAVCCTHQFPLASKLEHGCKVAERVFTEKVLVVIGESLITLQIH